MSIELLPRSAGDEPKTTGVPSPQERVLSPHIKTHGQRRVEHGIRTVFILLAVGKLPVTLKNWPLLQTSLILCRNLL
jgi:hypothetical protein